MKMKRMISLIMISVILMFTLAGCNKTQQASGDLSLVGEEVISVKEAKDTVMFTVEDESVTLDEMYLYYIQYLFNNKVKASDLNEGKINELKSTVVSQMMMETVEYLLALQMEEIEVTEETLASVQASADNFYNFFGKDTLSHYGIDKDTVDKVFRKQAYVTAVTGKAIEDLSVTTKEQCEEEYKDLVFHSITYALFPSVEYKDGVVVKDDQGNAVNLSEDKLKEQLSKAQELRKRAMAGEKTLEELIEEYDISYCSGVERNYEGAYAAELNDVVKKMENGDFSDVIKTDAGYMVARMDNKNDTEYRDYMITYVANQQAQSLLPKMQEKWAQQAGLDSVAVDETALSAIDAKAICEEMEMKGYY